MSAPAAAFEPGEFLKTLTSRPGIYKMLDGERTVLYVGKAGNLKKRVASYFRKTGLSAKTRALVDQIADIEVAITHTEVEALLLESNLIKQLRPRYNVLLRDDKSYPYIYLSSEQDFPRVCLHRGARRRKAPIQMQVLCVKVCIYCKNCSRCVNVKTVSSLIAAGPACSTRSNAVPHPALHWSARQNMRKTCGTRCCFSRARAAR